MSGSGLSDAIDQVGGTLGLIGDTIGLISNIADGLFPPPPSTSINNIRIWVGSIRTDDSDSRSTGGDAPALAAWDVSGKFMNQVTPDGISKPKIANGGFRDYSIEGRQQIDYLSVVRNGNDGVCIHLITGQSAGGLTDYMWTGNVGKECGAPWYQQNRGITNNLQDHFPACVWIDGNADEEHIWTGFNMHLGSFRSGSNTNQTTTVEAIQGNRGLLCKSEPRFSLYEDVEIGNQIRTFRSNPTAEQPGTDLYPDLVLNSNNWDWGEKPPAGKLPLQPNGKAPKIQCIDKDCPPTGPSFNRDLPKAQETRRRLRSRLEQQHLVDHERRVARIKKRQAIHADRLIVSKIGEHSAMDLCNSPYSLGPDFVAVNEGMFCDMSEKQLWPVCSQGDSSASYCFDMDTQTVKGSTISLQVSEELLHTNSTSPASAPGIPSLVAGNSESAIRAVPNKYYISVDTWG